jgi:glycine hydroxymethyltransferase
MTTVTSGLTQRSQDFIAVHERRLRERAPLETVVRVEELLADHDRWRARQCLNMNPAESLLSRRCRQLLMSDMATRLTEGHPGDKLYPHGRQNEHVDEIEAIVIALARQLFGARHVEWRPVSTSMALAVAFFAHLRPGDVTLTMDPDNGGNYAYNRPGPIGLTGATVLGIPARGRHFEIDLERLASEVDRVRPRMLVVGASNVLFPYPLRELRTIADRCGALLIYDAAHLGLLVSAGNFQRPLAEGAHAMVISTHKVMGGPVGGMLLTDSDEIAARVIGLTFPGFLQTRDLNKYAALACSLAETANFGSALAGQMVANAQALARALEAEGFRALAGERGYTQTHQTFLDLGERAKEFETRCHAANMLVTDVALAGDVALRRRSGARLATHELTRLGMAERDMDTIAQLMSRAMRGEDPAAVCADVESLVSRHRRIVYGFDEPDL